MTGILRIRTSKRVAVTALVALALAMLSSTTATAHSARTFFPGTWPLAQRGAVQIFGDGTLKLEKLTRVLEGAKTWDKLGRSLDFTWKGNAPLSRNACDRTLRGRNLIAMAPIDGRGGDLAMTSVCRSATAIVRFVTVFDSAEAWYFGTSKDVPAGRPDLLSVATHEFGHAAGWAHHYDDPVIGLGRAICGSFSGQHTMCARHYGGTARQRSLGPHDVETFNQIY